MPDRPSEDIEEVQVEDLTIRVDRNACSAFKDCLGIAPEAFVLGDDDIVTFRNPSSVEQERLIEACSVCPVNALIVIDGNGKRVVG